LESFSSKKSELECPQIKRNIQDRMSTVEPDLTSLYSLFPQKPLQARLKEFFTTNQLSQFMQQENILTEL